MLKQKKSNKNKLMRYTRKKQGQTEKNYGVCFHTEKNGMCTKYTKLSNTRIYRIWFRISEMLQKLLIVHLYHV